MQQKIRSFFSEKFQDRNLLILGYGKEGKSTYQFIRSLLPEAPLTIADQGLSLMEDKQIDADDFVDYYLGDTYLDALEHCDYIIKSPGISLKDIQIDSSTVVTSQTDLFVELFRNQIVGVTGTKGKSTTVTLIRHILEAKGKEVFLLGNIGKPAFESISDLKEESIVVLEMSSHQLEYCQHSPKYAIILNLFQEHLDHYSSYLHYQNAKLNVCKWQKEGDRVYYCCDNELLVDRMEELALSSISFSFGSSLSSGIRFDADEQRISLHGDSFAFEEQEFHLKGLHNRVNSLSAIAVAFDLGVSIPDAVSLSQSFKGLPHRMEYVGLYAQRHFYNDSIATIPEASLMALQSIESVNTLVIGGFDRGIDYASYLHSLVNSSLSAIILLGELTDSFYSALQGEFNGELRKASSMYEAVKLCFELTPKKGTCLLSPAASSYDQFKNFEDRGNQFKALVTS